ncbi:MAG: chromate transporter [Clostridia bacterium]|nr:chromate transporter [Clostridia bacterium]
MKAKKLWTLFSTFFKIGGFTFGGGYAMIPLIQREVVEKHGWASEDDILEILAIAESTPGPIAINSATFIGSRVAGFWGSACATLGVVLPSYLIITLIAFVLRNFLEVDAVRYAFFGIRAGVLALILKSLWTMAKKCPKTVLAYGIAAAAFLISALFDINVLFIIIGAAVVGIVSSLILERRAKK